MGRGERAQTVAFQALLGGALALEILLAGGLGRPPTGHAGRETEEKQGKKQRERGAAREQQGEKEGEEETERGCGEVGGRWRRVGVAGRGEGREKEG